MVPRKKLSEPEPASGGLYFPPSRLKFIGSGSVLLDAVLGGGWPLGRVSNIVGDKAVGKTLLAIEAAANFAAAFKGTIHYRESEAAFDEDYAATLGLPLDRVDFGPAGIGTQWDTIEDIFEDLIEVLAASAKSKQPGLYVIDSLDALSSRSEIERDIDKGSYNLDKQKILGELFRRHVRDIKASSVHIMFINQIRDKIGVMFGEKYTRTGGKALDFYASQVVWLSNLGVDSRTIRGVKRPVAVRVRAKCKKNKVGLPFRECEFDIRFGYGIEDVESCLEWLIEVKRLEEVNLTKEAIPKWLEGLNSMSQEGYHEAIAPIKAKTAEIWAQIESEFRPARRKY